MYLWELHCAKLSLTVSMKYQGKEQKPASKYVFWIPKNICTVINLDAKDLNFFKSVLSQIGRLGGTGGPPPSNRVQTTETSEFIFGVITQDFY